jgi:hypothetical protein
MNRMQTISVDKARLLALLKSNRDKHHKDYEGDVRTFRKAARILLEKTLKRVKPEDAPIGKHPTSLMVTLSAPQSYVKEYDRLIQMLEMETRDKVELTPSEFQQYVQDNWTWQHNITSNKLSYSNTIHADEFAMPAGSPETESIG